MGLGVDPWFWLDVQARCGLDVTQRKLGQRLCGKYTNAAAVDTPVILPILDRTPIG